MKQVKKALAWLLVLCMVVPMFSTVITTQAEETTDSELLNYDAMSIEQIMDLEQTITWVFTGDSITHNDVWTQGMNSYSEWFEQYLYTVGRGDDAVINTAWGGAAIRDFQTAENTPSGYYGANHDAGEGLDKYVLSYNPDVVFIKLGMNDRQTGTTDEFIKYYKMMVDSIYEAGAANGKIPKIIVSSPTPVSDENVYDDMANSGRGETVVNNSGATVFYDGTRRFRDALEKLVEEYNGKGYHMIFNDLRTAFLDEAGKLGDDYLATFFRDPSDGTIHPNAAGQYLIFKTLSKTLGIYDETNPIYQFEYDDINWAALYDGDTDGVTYTNGYAADISVTTVDDNKEMNKTMASVEGLTPIASVDFSSANGVLDMGGAATNAGGSAGFSITQEGEGIDPLTQTEAAGLENAFSVVFRAKFAKPYQSNQAVLFVSANGTASWNDALTVGTAGSSQQLWYRIMQGGSYKLTKHGQINLDSGTTIAKEEGASWHTVAITQDAGTISYYVDGTLVDTATGYTLTSGVTSIGSLFEGATNFKAQIGRYGETGGGPTFTVNGSFDYWQFYDTALTSAQVSELASENSSDEKTTWADSITENYVWAIAGAEQMSGYNGLQVNRSLMRQLDNAMRGGAHASYSQRDIRLVNAAAPGNTVASMIENYEDIIGKHDADVLLLLPEIPHVYADDYTHSEEAVDDYKASVKALLAKSEAKVNILWSPLASGNDEINTYINDYAKAVREIAAGNSNVLFFDANKFMNDNMAENAVLKRNWFDDDMYITPLASVDLAISFYSSMDEEGAITYSGTTAGIRYSELISHNLRYTSDERVFKSEYVRDNIVSDVVVSGTTVRVDVSAIKAEYSGANIVLKVMPEINAGNYHTGVRDLTEVAEVAVDGNVYTFTAPCKDLHLAVYGEQGELVYRFKDISVVVDGAADTLPEKEVEPADGAYLISLEVVGAPELAFNKDTTTYDVNLYQYQRFARIVAKAHEDLTITVNGKEVESGVCSDMITVAEANKTETVTVKVSGTVNGESVEQTYTLNLCRPEYPDIIITEVMSYGYGDSYELIEIYNASGEDLNLADYSIGFKRQYPTGAIEVDGETQYYFTGNDQAFAHTLYTGINQITKVSSHWSDTEPAEITFKADSTMVIWVKLRAGSGTYTDLVNAMTATPDKTLNVDIDGTDTEIIPNIEQLVVAEVPKGETVGGQGARANSLAKDSLKHFYLANANVTVRNWLFVLNDSAVMAENGAITEAGNDIVSATRYNRISNIDGLSNVFSYNEERGMSLVKNESSWIDDTGAHTSDEQGYGTYTSFGAIEYWQKPYDFADTEKPAVENKTPSAVGKAGSAQIELAISDNADVRYAEVYYKNASASEWTKVTKDYVLESTVKNSGVATDITETTFASDLTNITDTVEYYGYVVDGNNNVTEFGTEEEPFAILVSETEGYTKAQVEEYKNTDSYPTREGYLFGGWYLDSECVSSPVEDVTEITETAYALFVPETVLSVKAQISETLIDNSDTNNQMGDIRFITTVDTLRYQKVGFKISFVKDGEEISKEASSNKVYTKLYAVGLNDGETLEYTPKVFNASSNYFKACTITGITEDYYGVTFTVTPFWITIDGTYVEGITATKAINDGRYEAKIGSTYYATLEEAVEEANIAETETTVTVLRDAEIESQMDVSGNVTIQNAEGTNVVIYRGSGINASNMLNVATGATLNVKCDDKYGSLTLDGRTVANKAVTDTSNLTASSASLISNAGTLNVENVTVQYAKTSDGGAGIYTTSKVDVTNSVFKNNTAAARGGAILVNDANAVLTVENSKFVNNAALHGGAIYNASNAQTILKTDTSDTLALFANNVATGEASTSNYGGGAICVGSGNITVDGYTFQENSAYRGGAIALRSANVSAIRNATFKDNEATAENGGAISSDSQQIQLENSTFISNEAKNGQGGAIYALSVKTGIGIQVTNCTFGGTSTTTDKYALGNIARDGGAIYGAGSSVVTVTSTSEDARFEGNKATANYGGGALCTGSGTLTVDGYTFKNNTTSKTGGAIHFRGTTLTFKNTVTFKGNDTTGTNTDGGAVYMYNGTMNADTGKTIFEDNKAQRYGGGVYIRNAAITVNLKGAEFTNNSAQTAGAICNFATLNVTDVLFDGNDAVYATTGGEAGAIWSNDTATIIDCKFESNTATHNGGAIVMAGGTMSLSNDSNSSNVDAVVQNNSAGVKGGGIYYNAGTLTLNAGYVFTNNTQAGTTLNDVYLNNADLTINNVGAVDVITN